MRRRAFLALATALWPAHPYALLPGDIPHIGYLSPGSARVTPRDEAFLRGLRDLGYVDGANMIIEYRFAEGHFDRLPEMAGDLVQAGVAVIVAVVTQASLAARDATRSLPIVMVAVSDPLGTGLIESFARPGHNVTGTSSMSAEVIGKSVELLKEAVPGLARLAVLWNPANGVFQAQMLSEASRAAGALDVQVVALGASDAKQMDEAFLSIAGRGMDALLVLSDPLFVVLESRLLDLIRKSNLPAISGLTDFAEAGGLMAFGPNMASQFYRAAMYVDRILKGADAGELPVDRPTEFDLTLNLRAAKAIGLTFSLSLLGRADKVIE